MPSGVLTGYSRGTLVAVGAADSALLHAFVKRGPFLAGEMLNFPTMRVRVSCGWLQDYTQCAWARCAAQSGAQMADPLTM